MKIFLSVLSLLLFSLPALAVQSDVRQPVCIVDNWGEESCGGAVRNYIDGSTTTSTSTTIYEVTENRTLYVDSITISVLNTNVSNNAIVNIRDGSTKKVPVVVPVAGLGALAAAVSGTLNTVNFSTPKRFLSDFNIEIEAGTVVVSVSFTGYER